MAHEQRELAYSDLRVFVGAYREAISQGLIALPWTDAPTAGTPVAIALKVPFNERPFMLHGEISQRKETGVVVALQPLASDTSFELDAHVALLEGVLKALHDAILDHVTQGDQWKGLQIPPCTGVVDSSRISTRPGLVNVTVNVDELLPYLYLHRTHLENRELFIQMNEPVDVRAVLHVHLGLPFLGREVELRGVVTRSLSDGIFVDLAPYPRSTRKLFEWYWRLVEQAAAEATTTLAKTHGQAAVNAIRALLPRSSAGIADVVGPNEASPATTSSAPTASVSAEPLSHISPQEEAAQAPTAPESAPTSAPLASAPPPEPVTSAPVPEAPSAPDKPASELPNLFTRRRSVSGRTRGTTNPSMDALSSSLESSMLSSPTAGGAESGSAPVIPVLMGDGTGASPQRRPRHDTLTSFERSERPENEGRQTLSRMIGRGSSQLGAIHSPRQRGAVASQDFVAPPVEESSPNAASAPPRLGGAGHGNEVQPHEDSHADIDIFKRPAKRSRAKTIPPSAGGPIAPTPPPAPEPAPPVTAPPPAPRVTAPPPPSEPAPRAMAPPPPSESAPRAMAPPPPPEPAPRAMAPTTSSESAPVAPESPPIPDPAPVAASTAPHGARVVEDDLVEDDLGAVLRPQKGTLADRSLVEVLGELYRQNATGVLKLQGETRLTTLSFRKGRVTHIAESPPQDTAMLGAQFITLGVSKHEMTRAINESKSENKLLGRVLLESRTIIKSQVKQALISQLKMRIGTIDGFESASYEYVDGVGVRREDAPNVDPVKLLFRGRFEYYMQRSKRENQVESHTFSGSFVRQRNRGRRWINRFGLSLPQQGAWELIESGELKLSQLYPKLSVDQTTVFSTLFALRDFGCVEFRTKKQEEQTREAIEKRFQEKMDVLRTGNQFDILDVHWTSTDLEVQKGYDYSLRTFDPKNIDKPSELMRSLSKEILPAVEEAYTLLKDKNERVAYRESIMTPDKIRSAAEHLVEQGDMELFKNDLRLAREKFRRAIELLPNDKKLKRKLNDTFTISGQAAAQSQTKVEHKPAVTLPGED